MFHHNLFSSLRLFTCNSSSGTHKYMFSVPNCIMLLCKTAVVVGNCYPPKQMIVLERETVERVDHILALCPSLHFYTLPPSRARDRDRDQLPTAALIRLSILLPLQRTASVQRNRTTLSNSLWIILQKGNGNLLSLRLFDGQRTATNGLDVSTLLHYLHRLDLSAGTSTRSTVLLAF